LLMDTLRENFVSFPFNSPYFGTATSFASFIMYKLSW
jgi:hypothetical protein